MKSIFYFGLVVLFFSSCVKNNVSEKEAYKTIFNKYKVKGSYGMLDNAYNVFNVYNLKRFRDSAYAPASTFKIINSLIGLETGKIDEKEVVKWDGIKREYEQWNKDQNYETAFQNSTVWYFQNVARKIGKDTMQRYLDSLHYGSTKITGPIDMFWLDNSITIKADEQMGIVKKLYFNQFSNLFSNRTMQKVKDAMLVEKTDKYSLSYKSGLLQNKNGTNSSWMIGWVEYGGANKKVSFFVLHIEAAMTSAEMMLIRKPMLMDLIKEENLF
jgi:beta-lactamase class D